MREGRARRWRYKIDDLVAFFCFSLYKSLYSACFSFFVIVECSALAYL